MSDATFRQQLLDALRTDPEVQTAVLEVVTAVFPLGVNRVQLYLWTEQVKKELLQAVADARQKGGSFTARMRGD